MTVTARSGIPTTYRAGRFRSRLEARWATFFDLVGWSWVYEPLDCEGYIPDFLIEGSRPFFVEVGPCITAADYDDKAAKPDAAVRELGHDILIVGASPAPLLPLASGSLAAGWLGEFIRGHNAADCPDRSLGDLAATEPACDHGPVYGWATAAWAWCRPLTATFPWQPPHLAIYSSVHSYTHRPCAERSEQDLEDRRLLEDLWQRAGTKTQWLGR